MSPSTAKTFRAVLEPDGTNLKWVVARVPFDPVKVWPVRRRLRVRGEIEGFAFRTSLFPDPRRNGHILLVNKKMQAAAHAGVGAAVKITLEPDLEEREAVIPSELAKALKGDRRLSKWYETLNYSTRKAIGDFVTEPKGTESRQKRADEMAERLLMTMEGEKELPPILRAAFQRQPLAGKGWEAMTPLQRRGHLFGISYYGSTEARERRAAKVVEQALRVAQRFKTKPA